MNSSVPVALLISLFFPPESGGGATGAWNRAQVLHKVGYAVFILCGFPAYPTGRVSQPKYKGKFIYVEANDEYTVIRLRLIPLSHDGFIKRLIIFMHFILLTIILFPKILHVSGKPSLIYARAPILFSSVIGFVYSRITGSFFIYEAPDLWPEELVAFKTKLLPIIMALGRIAAKISYTTPDVIVTISEPAARLIIKEYRPRVSVYGIPVGVDPTKFPKMPKHNARAELSRRQVLPESVLNKFIVLYSGLISEAQRVETLVHAAEKLKDEKDIVIVIIGDGPQKRKLLQFKLDRNLENLYFLDRQPREMMPFIISAADSCSVMLSSESIFDIALPTKFYEYLASGKPLIGVCSGILADIIMSNDIGRVVNDDDPAQLASIITEFKNSPNLVDRMEDSCNSTLSKFSLNAIASDIEDMLNREGARTMHVKSG